MNYLPLVQTRLKIVQVSTNGFLRLGIIFILSRLLLGSSKMNGVNRQVHYKVEELRGSLTCRRSKKRVNLDDVVDHF